MGTIKAPYNFVPLNDVVYHPSWRNKISQDVPFENGMSGVLNLEITAESPIFVRNGHTKEQKKIAIDVCEKISKRIKKEIEESLHLKRYNEKYIIQELKKNTIKWKTKFVEYLKAEEIIGTDLSYLFFSNCNGKPFIPGTTIKGVLKNALEIISFGKISNHINDARYGFREMTELYLKDMNIKNIHCGYLKVNGDDITVFDHGIPYRISHENLDSQITGLNFTKHFGSEYKPSMKSPFYKKKLYNDCRKDLHLTNFKYEKDFKGRKIVTANAKGNINGIVVLTGQQNHSNSPKGKSYEFVFPSKEIKGDNRPFKFKKDDSLYKDFEFTNRTTDDWEKWMEELKTKKEVPVFFTVINNRIRDFGFSYMYKRPCKYSVGECLYDEHFSKERDLSQCVFGTTLDNPLKGRVSFSNAFSNNEKRDLNLFMQLILGSPKASYYPIYLEQNSTNYTDFYTVNKYKTYQDQDIKISGWKKYSIRKKAKESCMYDSKLDTFLVPLAKKTKFNCKMKFFNLKEEELGALLSTITFHGSKDEFYHSIGQGKPYGLGKVKMKLCSLKIDDQLLQGDDLTEKSLFFMRLFEEDITKDIKSQMDDENDFTWNSSDTISEFYTLSSEFSDEQIEYMELKDYREAKKNKEFLKRYTELVGIDKYPKKLIK